MAGLTEAASGAVGAPGAVPGSDAEARACVGDYFAECCCSTRDRRGQARAELDWHPTHPSLTDEFRHGSYRQ